jgi:hypothetical protein
MNYSAEVDMDAQEHIQKKREEAAKAKAEADGALTLMEQFPDLEINRNRWNRERYSTKEVNSLTTDCDISHNCGCCPDSPLEVWPFVQLGPVKVYSKPARFTVGEKAGYGERSYAGWQTDMEKEGISDAVIQKVAKYLDDNQEDWGDDDDD